MRKLSILIALVLVLSFSMVTAVPVRAASIVENVCFDLTAVNADPLWVKTGVGAIIPVSDTISGPLEVTRTTWDVGGSKNWLIEAVVSSLLPGIADEAGARIWVRARMDGDSELQYRDIEVRLMKEASNADNFIGLYSHTGLAQTTGGSDAKIVLRWDQHLPRYRIRLMRVGDEIIMEAEPSNVFDDHPSKQSIAVPLNIANFPPLIGIPNLQQVGFGNGKASGNQISTWENIHITVCDDATTVLPYWPPQPPAPTLVHDDKGMDSLQGIDFSVNLISSGYLTNDSVTPELDADGTTYYGETRMNPGDEFWDFDGLNSDQTVYGRVVVSDVSGRSVTGSDGSAIIPVMADKGFDEFGFNYQARLFNGLLGNVDRNSDSDPDKLYGADNDVTTIDGVDYMIPVPGTHLVMKWSKAWDNARFHGGDWNTDAWCTNHDVWTDAEGKTHTAYYRIEWTGPGGELWKEFTITRAIFDGQKIR